jgi:hypothetical protein
MVELIAALLLLPSAISLGFLAYFCIRWVNFRRKRKYTTADHAKDFLGIFATVVPKLLNEEERRLMRGIVLSMASLIVCSSLVILGVKQFQ